MKKTILLIFGLFYVVLNAMSMTESLQTYKDTLYFRMTNEGRGSGGDGDDKIPHRSPAQCPRAIQEDNTLYFTASFVGDELRLVQNGNVVYTEEITSGVIVLPVEVLGECELQIICGSYKFYTEIEL